MDNIHCLDSAISLIASYFEDGVRELRIEFTTMCERCPLNVICGNICIHRTRGLLLTRHQGLYQLIGCRSLCHRDDEHCRGSILEVLTSLVNDFLTDTDKLRCGRSCSCVLENRRICKFTLEFRDLESDVTNRYEIEHFSDVRKFLMTIRSLAMIEFRQSRRFYKTKRS